MSINDLSTHFRTVEKGTQVNLKKLQGGKNKYTGIKQ